MPDFAYSEYFPYGEVWVNERTEIDDGNLPYKYTGKEYDPETKLTYYGARYYDAKLSRWISVDPPLISGEYLPTGNKDHDAKLPGMGGVFNPINLDAYQYGGMNPVKYVDPDGNYLVYSKNNTPGLYDVMFKNKVRRNFEAALSFIPYGTASCHISSRGKAGNGLTYHYDSDYSVSSTFKSTLFDVAGSKLGAKIFSKSSSKVATWAGRAYGAWGTFSNAKKDRLRKQLLGYSGLVNKDGSTLLASDDIGVVKARMERIDAYAAFYESNIKGTDNDPGLPAYAKQVGDRFKKRDIPQTDATGRGWW